MVSLAEESSSQFWLAPTWLAFGGAYCTSKSQNSTSSHCQNGEISSMTSCPLISLISRGHHYGLLFDGWLCIDSRLSCHSVAHLTRKLHYCNILRVHIYVHLYIDIRICVYTHIYGNNEIICIMRKFLICTCQKVYFSHRRSSCSKISLDPRIE